MKCNEGSPTSSPSPPSQLDMITKEIERRNRAEKEEKLRRKRKNIILRYLSCLCPSDPNQHIPVDTSENVILRLLKKECWTDGTLMSLKTDIFSGITLAVAQVAPSIAFALMGHGAPLVGLFSSFFLGIIPCIFGGRPGQITAIAGAVVVLYPDLVDKHGFGAVCMVSIIAGCFILIPGILRLASLVRLLPASLMLGFCNGLAISMIQHQIPSFKNEKGEYLTGTTAFCTAVICIVSFAVMMLMPYFTTIIPSAFAAIVVGTVMEYAFQMKTVTIGHLYELHGNFPAPNVPSVDWGTATGDVMVAAVLTAIISCIESFMSDYKITQLTETPTNFEREALSLGVAHIVNGFFSGMPGCVVYGPCILNIECESGTRRLSGFICAVLMMIIPLALFAVIRIIPMGALSAVVFGVSVKTADLRMFAMIFLQRISFQESAVAIVVTVVTVVEDLAIGAACGFAAALLFFMWNMARGRVSMTPVMNSAPYATFVTQESLHQNLSQSYNVTPGGNRDHPLLVDKNATTPREPASGGFVTSEPHTSAELPLDTSEEFSPREGGGTASIESVSVEVETNESGGVIHVPEEVDAEGPVDTAFQHNSLIVVNLLDVQKDTVFPEVKVLRVRLRGVLFFGSCMSFVDQVMKLLHRHHGEIFLKVTDFILDFDHGMMTLMDFSACEALQDAGRILAKRGIRTHVQNMDPLSYTCFTRCRRYFNDVIEDDVNNTKHICYARHVFRRTADSAQTQIVHQEDNEDVLDDHLFVGDSSTVQPTVATADRPDGNIVLHARETEEVAEDKPLREENEDAASEVAPMSSTEVQPPFEDTIKVGFSIYRPQFGITVPVFDTINGWRARIDRELASETVSVLEIGVTTAKPLNRMYYDISKVWVRRLLNRDVPLPTDLVPTPVETPTKRQPGPLRRDPPGQFAQVPRFPGQGYGKHEEFSRLQWHLIRKAVCKRIFRVDPPKEHNRFVLRMQRFERELADGFI